MNASGSDFLGHLELPILGLFPLISEVGWQGYLVLLVLNIRCNSTERYQPQMMQLTHTSKSQFSFTVECSFSRYLEAGLELLEVPDGHHNFVQALLNL